MTKKYLHLLYGIILSVVLVICGICLIVACVDIYDFQAGSFSRESVAAAFDTISIPVFCCLALVIVGFLIDAFSFRETKLKPEKQYETILQNLCKKVDITQCPPELVQAIRKKRIWRMAWRGCTAGVLVFCSSLFFGYALNAQNYPDDANTAVLQAMPLFFTCLALPCCFAIFTAYHKKFSMRKEIELVKQALAQGAASDAVPAVKEKKQTGVIIARYSVLVIAVVVLVVGFCFGGMADVLAKAAAICTECVGLG